MPFFSFLTRRRSPNRSADRARLKEKSVPVASSTTIDRRSSKRSRRRASANRERSTEARPTTPKEKRTALEKENMPPVPRRGSIENITALPVSNKLATSPHLRPADTSDLPHIPYNFRPYSMSANSVQEQERTFSRPRTLRSRASGTPSRRPSGKGRTPKQVREEEIRAMSSPIPIPKRPGEGPLRTDSKKLRRGFRGSMASLAGQESVHSSMSGVMDQRGWEVGFMDVFNPRPAVRLSGVPQGVASSSAPVTSHLSPSPSRREKNKMPVSRGSARKHDTIGEAADELGAGELRLLMERDKKRKEKRDQERQEKLDRKLRSRNGRNRGDSDRKEREAEEQRKEQESQRHANEEKVARATTLPPTAIHPALRDEPMLSNTDVVGLGIGAGTSSAQTDANQDEAHALLTTEELGTKNTGTYLLYDDAETIPATDPFADPVTTPSAVEPEEGYLHTRNRATSPLATPLESPLEEPVMQTAQAMSITQQMTPPLSPVRTNHTDRAPSSLSQVYTPDLPLPRIIPTERRTSEPKDKRAGAWASFFRRGGTNLRRPSEAGGMSDSTSFSNVSRESMRTQPLPAHLVDTQAPNPARRKSGTPTRTQSKFREDLPEMPLSPPDSRMPSPDVTQAAAIAAAVRRGKRVPKPVDIPGARTATPEGSSLNRNDTPVSPSTRGHHGPMSASMASVDSEGSWLASAGKRRSTQSALSRSMGSLRQRRQDFTGSYEELPGDRDAEYVARPGQNERSRLSTSALAGASPSEDSDPGDPDLAALTHDPLTVHGSVRRHPTIINRDSRVKSREGLLASYEDTTPTPDAEAEANPLETGGEAESPSSIYRDEFDLAESPAPQVHSAKSVNYGKGHARQLSAGSAKLLDIASKRPSLDAGARTPGGSSASPQLPAARASPLPASRLSQL
ncbi:hypothetical protein LTR62_006035 [Meristemomyces frigidus]|uniref:Uncharacterized protein n=1 Tax=Meristemomyces frigidus TaxID=1508187 RepID=A0AAN7TP54_9PEZI|nr:hypothetical protein LTR62_006035 [Meristemomyces frigidus]